MTTTTTRLDAYLERTAHDVWSGLGALAVIDVLRSSVRPCTKTMDHNSFLSMINETATHSLLLALARLLEDSPKFDSLSVTSLFRYAAKHPYECVWLHGPEGSRRYPDGNAELVRRQQAWESWLQSDNLAHRIKTFRDKLLAHTDRSLIDSANSFDPFQYKELGQALEKVGYFINELSELTRNHETFHSAVHEQVFKDGVYFMAMEEAMHQRIDEDRRNHVWQREESEFWQRVKPLAAEIEDEYQRITGSNRRSAGGIP